MFSGSKKPYSAISVQIEHLTAETYEEDDLAGIPDLIEVVRLQGSGPAEASRAIRKKLKYGNVHRQLRALTVLDGMLQNGGPRLQRSIFADEPLLERLRIAATDPVSDPDVRAKCKVLFGQWSVSFTEIPRAASLYRQLPRKTRAPIERREQSKVLRETEEDARREEDEEPQRRTSVSASGPASPRPAATSSSSHHSVQLSAAQTFHLHKSNKKDKKNKTKAFVLEKEKPMLLQTIAASSVASTNLTNALKLVNREDKRVSEDQEAMKRFETCKQLRRQVLRYIQFVETDDFLGGLIHANEELVTALMAFEVLDKSVDDDSDSELEEAQHLSRQSAIENEKAAAQSMSKMNLGPKKPPRPGNIALPAPGAASAYGGKGKTIDSDEESDDDEDDEDDPFGDRNAAATPGKEKRGYSWREI